MADQSENGILKFELICMQRYNEESWLLKLNVFDWCFLDCASQCQIDNEITKQNDSVLVRFKLNWAQKIFCEKAD